MDVKSAHLGLSILVLFTCATVAYGGSVRSVNAKKRTIVVDLEDGETYEKDAEVCVFTDTGKKVDCGTVTRAKGATAQVKLKSKKRIKRVKPGMPVRSPDEAASETAASGSGGKPGASPFRIWGFYSPALATPAVFNKLGYAAPADSETSPATLWSSDATVGTALFGFNFQVGIPIGNYSLNPGLRYRTFTPSQIDSDFVQQKENPFVRTEQTASALGLWLDFQYLRIPMLTSSSLWLSSGLDIDMSTVTLTSTKLDDTGATPESEIGKADSKLNVASLRLSGGFDLVFAKPLGAFIGLTLMIPLTEFGASFSGSLAEGEDRGQADPGADLKTSLGHKKNSAAYEISLGGVLSL